MNRWQELRGKRVRVHASGVEYRGTVVEMGPASLILRAESGFREIPWDRVARLEEDRGSPGGGDPGPMPSGWG